MTKTILITGASTGVGAATAVLFAERGWNVVATMRDLGSGPAVEHDNILRARLDVTDKASIESAITVGSERFGSIDAVVNNAGYGEFGVFEAIDDAKVRANFDVNVFGVMNVIRAILPRFRERNNGLIVNVSSGGGIIGLPATGIYLSTKFALEGFSESIWFELDALGIGLKLVEPGGISTPFLTKITGQAATNIPPDDYRPFVEKIKARMAELNWERSSPEDIAEVIWTSVTDGSRRLRYFHGPGIKHLVDGRHSSTDQDYESLMRREFNVV
ncbi:SDR family oxidoreductase [Rhizobium leguminosarum]|uniref:SDR family oxidoreductase n=1 Tax=Rhizobium leguminosarum TaxID=384 RepID=UPI00143F3BCF|nr:SDR family oxidoreductase [Rhizobium leguminosarum]NKL24723.1 SDR family NAD(P)-dependent oxidoreductase [Rhizobium leguminosarum bv. viciae]